MSVDLTTLWTLDFIARIKQSLSCLCGRVTHVRNIFVMLANNKYIVDKLRLQYTPHINVRIWIIWIGMCFRWCCPETAATLLISSFLTAWVEADYIILAERYSQTVWPSVLRVLQYMKWNESRYLQDWIVTIRAAADLQGLKFACYIMY